MGEHFFYFLTKGGSQKVQKVEFLRLDLCLHLFCFDFFTQKFREF